MNNHNIEKDRDEKRKQVSTRLTDDEIDTIAYLAADLVIEAIYTEIGKVTVRAILLLSGTIGTALLAWFGIIQKIGHGG